MRAVASLADLFAADRREHAAPPPVGTADYAALRLRDRRRRRRAAAILAALGEPAAEDQYHAAWLFNHGDTPEDARRAHELAAAAASRGHPDAPWLAAAAFDRWCMYRGLPQRYGTQIVPDGVRFRVWDTDTGVTDSERARHGVPPLERQHERARELTRTEPQPSLREAPRWLRDALVRWWVGDPGTWPGVQP